MINKGFKQIVDTVLSKYEATPLRKRWEEATSFGAADKATAFWIRDSEDVVNIVWLSHSSIRDIVWFPSSNQVAFSFLPLRNVKSIEVREAPDLSSRLGFPVKGDLVIRLFCTNPLGNLAWVANTEEQTNDLLAFAQQVFTAYTVATGA